MKNNINNDKCDDGLSVDMIDGVWETNLWLWADKNKIEKNVFQEILVN